MGFFYAQGFCPVLIALLLPSKAVELAHPSSEEFMCQPSQTLYFHADVSSVVPSFFSASVSV